MKKLLLLVLVASASLLHASITTYSNLATFNAQGTIVYNTDFSSCPVGYCSPGDPYTIGGVTYTTGTNLIVGLGTGYGNSVPVFVNDFWTPLPASIETSPTHDMLGFLLGSLGGTSPMEITVYTNLTSYSWTGVSVPNVNTGLQFLGCVTSGEYLTAFKIASVNGQGYAPAITNVEIGDSTVPEPGTFVMLGSGVLALAGVVRRRLML